MRHPPATAGDGLTESRGYRDGFPPDAAGVSPTVRDAAAVTTIRNLNRERYTTVGRELINDPVISFRAKGILVWLLDKPDGWFFDSTRLSQEFPEGRDAIRTALKELTDAGYLLREKVKDGAGKWTTITEIRESPGQTRDGFPGVGFPGPGFPTPGFPRVGFPGAITNTEPKTEIKEANPSVSPHDVLAKEWWESRETKPNQSFVAARGVIKKALGAGWEEERLRGALKEIPVVSGGALDVWASKHPAPKPKVWDYRSALAHADAWFRADPERMAWLQRHEHEQRDWMERMHNRGATDEAVAQALIDQLAEPA